MSVNEMFFNKKIFLIILFLSLTFKASASLKENIILKFKNVENVSFNFQQNVNGKIERGICTILYPKKIFCDYDLGNQKILVSDGKWLVVKTTASYYKYPLDKTPLNYLLNKDFLIKKITTLDHRLVENKLINFNFTEKDNEINIFFDSKSLNLVGWQTLDLYQNLNITYLDSIKINQKLKNDIFRLPKRN